MAQVRDGRPPTAWALVLSGLVTTLTVLLFIPMAWDRYYLPIQAPAIRKSLMAIEVACLQTFTVGAEG
jgi:hypothetical protein